MVDVHVPPGGFPHHFHRPAPEPGLFSHGVDIVTTASHQPQAQHHQPAHPATRLPALAPAPAVPAPTPAPGTEAEAAAHLRQTQLEWNDNIRKKYRTKLSKQFERLQALVVVPAAADQDQEGGPGGGRLRGDGRSTVRNGMGVNKARVLDLARRRIEGLVREREELRRERERLVAVVEERERERVGGRWGGVVG